MNLIEALKMAIEDEKAAVKHYQEMASQAPDAETRLLFEQIAKEEETHLQRLTARLKSLKAL